MFIEHIFYRKINNSCSWQSCSFALANFMCSETGTGYNHLVEIRKMFAALQVFSVCQCSILPQGLVMTGYLNINYDFMILWRWFQKWIFNGFK